MRRKRQLPGHAAGQTTVRESAGSNRHAAGQITVRESAGSNRHAAGQTTIRESAESNRMRENSADRNIYTKGKK